MLGAASQVGYRLLPMLEASGYSILAVTRSGRPGWASRVSKTHWLTATELAASCTDSVILVSAGPLPLAVKIASRLDGLKQIVSLSSASVQFKSGSSDQNEQKIMAELLAAERQLEQLSKSLGIPLTIFRPTLVYGSGLDENLCRLARWVRRFGWLPVAGKGAGLRQPVFAGDIARLVLEVILKPQGRQGIIPVAGGSRISYREMLEAVFYALDKKPRIFSLPVPLYGLLLRTYSLLRPGTGVSPAMAARQNRDLVLDTTDSLAPFSFSMAEFNLCKEHLETPGTAASNAVEVQKW